LILFQDSGDRPIPFFFYLPPFSPHCNSHSASSFPLPHVFPHESAFLFLRMLKEKSFSFFFGTRRRPPWPPMASTQPRSPPSPNFGHPSLLSLSAVFPRIRGPAEAWSSFTSPLYGNTVPLLDDLFPFRYLSRCIFCHVPLTGQSRFFCETFSASGISLLLSRCFVL